MNDIDVLVQGGAVGISLVLIWLVYKISQACSKTTERVLDVTTNNAKVMTELKDSIVENTKVTEKTATMIQNVTEMHRMLNDQAGR